MDPTILNEGIPLLQEILDDLIKGVENDSTGVLENLKNFDHFNIKRLISNNYFTIKLYHNFQIQAKLLLEKQPPGSQDRELIKSLLIIATLLSQLEEQTLAIATGLAEISQPYFSQMPEFLEEFASQVQETINRSISYFYMRTTLGGKQLVQAENQASELYRKVLQQLFEDTASEQGEEQGKEAALKKALSWLEIVRRIERLCDIAVILAANGQFMGKHLLSW